MPSWPTATLECFMPTTRRASSDASNRGHATHRPISLRSKKPRRLFWRTPAAWTRPSS
jgi:hypothetical protein